MDNDTTNNTMLTINEDLYMGMQFLNDQPYKRNKDLPNSYIVPDGAVLFEDASDSKLNFRL